MWDTIVTVHHYGMLAGLMLFCGAWLYSIWSDTSTSDQLVKKIWKYVVVDAELKDWATLSGLLVLWPFLLVVAVINGIRYIASRGKDRQ